MKFNNIKNICLIYIAILAGILLEYPVVAQTSQDSDLKFLEKISIASQELSFSALYYKEYFVQDSIRIYKKRIVKVDNNNIWEKYEYPARISNNIVITKDDVIITKHLDKDSVSAMRSSNRRESMFPSDNIALFRKNYKVKVLEEDVFNNIKVDVAKIYSRSRDRNWLKLWVDKKSGFIYQLERYDPDKNLLYREHVEELDFNIDRSIFEVKEEFKIREATRKSFESIADIYEQIDFSIMAPRFMPPGFVLDQIFLYFDEEGDPLTVMFNYSDGLTSFSLFQEHSDDKMDMEVGSRYTLNTKLYRIQAIKKNVHLRMYGDLPEDKMIDIFKTISRMPKGEIRNISEN